MQLPDGSQARVDVVRDVVRVVVLDRNDRILLFHTREPVRPQWGYWWELPGGGIEPGESYVDAAVRELAEEAGLAVDPADIGPPTWRRTATIMWRMRYRSLQHEVVALVRLAAAAPEVDRSGGEDYERIQYVDHRWWPVASVRASRERFYPGRLPQLLAPLLAGVEVDEPFERWY